MKTSLSNMIISKIYKLKLCIVITFFSFPKCVFIIRKGRIEEK